VPRDWPESAPATGAAAVWDVPDARSLLQVARATR
jgi:hypothetical protein